MLSLSNLRVAVPLREIPVDHLKVRHQDTMFMGQHPVHIQFIHPEAFPAARFRPFPEGQKVPERKIVIKAFFRITDQKESDPVLLLKQSHELHLMGVDILQRKRLLSALLGVKTYRDSLDHTYIVYGALLLKVRQGDMTGFLVHPYRCDRGRYFLDQSQLFKGTVRREDRSLMNVPFVTGDKEMDAKFVAAATEAGFVNLKGHRSVGGMRASIYNAMPIEGVQKLVAFMNDFEKENR